MSSPLDFSFLGADSGLQRKHSSAVAVQSASHQQQCGRGAPAPPEAGASSAQGSGSIAIPSFRDVQRAEKQRPASAVLLRPTSMGAGAPGAAANGSNAVASGASRTELHGGQLPLRSPAWQPPNAQQQHHQPLPQAPALGPSLHHPVLQRQPASQQPPSLGLQQPMPAPAQQQFPSNAIIVSKRQDGNPVLKYIRWGACYAQYSCLVSCIVRQAVSGAPAKPGLLHGPNAPASWYRNVRWQFGDIVPDYLLGRETACLFLSLRSQPECNLCTVAMHDTDRPRGAAGITCSSQSTSTAASNRCSAATACESLFAMWTQRTLWSRWRRCA
jgi:hypothetical protein